MSFLYFAALMISLFVGFGFQERSRISKPLEYSGHAERFTCQRWSVCGTCDQLILRGRLTRLPSYKFHNRKVEVVSFSALKFIWLEVLDISTKKEAGNNDSLTLRSSHYLQIMNSAQLHILPDGPAHALVYPTLHNLYFSC